MNMQKVFSYHLWRETQGEDGMRFLGVKVEGNKTYSLFKKIPEQDLYHLSLVVFGKNIDIVYKKGSKEGSLIKRLWK